MNRKSVWRTGSVRVSKKSSVREEAVGSINQSHGGGRKPWAVFAGEVLSGSVWVNKALGGGRKTMMAARSNGHVFVKILHRALWVSRCLHLSPLFWLGLCRR